MRIALAIVKCMFAAGVVLVPAAAFHLAPYLPVQAQNHSTHQGETKAGGLTSAATRLHRAARTGDVALLRSELQRGVSPNVADIRGQSALMIAAQRGHIQAVELLLQAGANVNARSQSGRTALIDAAEAGRVNTTRLLIQHGADLNAAARTGTALEAAERAGHMKTAALLREAGARASGHSLGDTVCVRPWGGEGYCGVVEGIDENRYRLRVTSIVGCAAGCPAKAECSADRPVGGAGGIAVGDQVETMSWCLTHTGVKP